jgi:hypothetical protein
MTLLKIRIIKSSLKEVGHFNLTAFSGYHDVPKDRECEECETRATQSRVVGEAAKDDNA